MKIGRVVQQASSAVSVGEVSVLTGFGRPFGLGFDLEGRFFVTDMDLHTVFRFDPDLSVFQILNRDGNGWGVGTPVEDYTIDKHPAIMPGVLNGPHSVDFDDSGSFYVTTYYAPCVHVFSDKGRKSSEIGNAQSSRHLVGPATAFFDFSGRLLVAEYALNAVLAFDRRGRYLGNIGASQNDVAVKFSDAETVSAASSNPGGFDRLHMCRQCADGSLIVADTWNHRLQQLGSDGAWMGWIGMSRNGCVTDGWCLDAVNATAGDRPGAMHAPVSVDIDPSDGRMLVADWGNDRLQVFNSDGRLNKVIEDLGLSSPYDARFSQGRIVVADSHNGRILVLREPNGTA